MSPSFNTVPPFGKKKKKITGKIRNETIFQ